MYNNFDYNELQRAAQESLAKIYKESFETQEYVDPEKAEETYRKIKVILDCPEMEKCHPFLYALDMENVNETDSEKIDKIYNLGVERGIIREEGCEKETPIETQQNECDDVDCGDENCASDIQSTSPEETYPIDQDVNLDQVEKTPIYTVLYSGTKEGIPKMGEFYSMAPDAEGAKEDCLMQLTQNGYVQVQVMAIEKTPFIPADPIPDNDEIQDDVTMAGIEEDDSEEFLKQETGDTSDSEEDAETEDKPEEEETEDDTTSAEYNNGNSENTSAENTEDVAVVDDNTEDSEVDNNDDDKEKETEDKDGDEEKEDGEEKEEDNDGDEEKPKKLSPEEKSQLKGEYTKIFKDLLKDMGVEKSVADMALKERTDFYSKLSEKWTKNDPSEFLTDDEQEKLNKTTVKDSEK